MKIKANSKKEKKGHLQIGKLQKSVFQFRQVKKEFQFGKIGRQ